MDFNAVIVNMFSLSPEIRKLCLCNIKDGVQALKGYLEENINTKENMPDIPETGMAVLQQQFILTKAIENWIISLEKEVMIETQKSSSH